MPGGCRSRTGLLETELADGAKAAGIEGFRPPLPFPPPAGGDKDRFYPLDNPWSARHRGAMPEPHAIDLICLDADDTLWHNMRHFAATQDALVAMLEPFADAGISRSALEACEIRNLPRYGYGAKAFTLSMIETALDLGGDDLPASVVRDILDAGRALHAHPVELFDGIDETLATLAERARLVLVTKGDLFHQEAKLAASGLGDHFSGIEIVSDKSAATFTHIFDRYGVEAGRALMAGDSMRSDVLPALEAGAWGVFIPQPLAWSHEQRDPPEDHPRYRRLQSLAELPSLVGILSKVPTGV